MADTADFWKSMESELFSQFGEESLSEVVPASQIQPKTAGGRRILNIFFIIDVSGSMRGMRIGQVNYAIENIIKELRTRDDLNSVIKVAIMEFCNEATWKTPTPILIDDYVFTPIDTYPAYTCYGKAFDALEVKLHKNGFMDPALGEYFAPLVMFVSDGEPTDFNEYPVALEKLKKNKWFSKSSKYAIAVGEGAKTEKVGRILEQFTGIRENVRYADEGAGLCNLIEYIAIRASEVQTSLVSSSYGGGKEQAQSIFNEVDNSLFSSIFGNQ